MEHLVHFFPVTALPPRLYCGGWREGDAWTALPLAVTCPECGRRVRAELDAARRTSDPGAER